MYASFEASNLQRAAGQRGAHFAGRTDKPLIPRRFCHRQAGRHPTAASRASGCHHGRHGFDPLLSNTRAKDRSIACACAGASGQLRRASRRSDCARIRLREIGRNRHAHAADAVRSASRTRTGPEPARGLHAAALAPRPRSGAAAACTPFGSLRAAATLPIRLLPYQLEPALVIARDGRQPRAHR